MPINIELRKAAAEIAVAGHAGWGNVCTDALNEIELLTAALAAQAGQSEPVAFMYQHDETGMTGFVDKWQLDNGWEKANPRLKVIGPLFRWPAPVRQPQEDVSSIHAPDAMDAVAIQYAHSLALELETVLLDYNGTHWDKAMQVVGDYRSAMNRIHELESPTFMGEPLIKEQQ